MGRTDSVDFKCDEEGCTSHLTYHESKPSSFVPDEWSVTFELDSTTKEERAVYRCQAHNP